MVHDVRREYVTLTMSTVRVVVDASFFIETVPGLATMEREGRRRTKVSSNRKLLRYGCPLAVLDVL